MDELNRRLFEILMNCNYYFRDGQALLFDLSGNDNYKRVTELVSDRSAWANAIMQKATSTEQIATFEAKYKETVDEHH